MRRGYSWFSRKAAAIAVALDAAEPRGQQNCTSRAMTRLDQSVLASYDYWPFGEESGGVWPMSHKFTGFEREAESGLDHTWFRKYSSSTGRWLSPDPLAGSIGDPQSLNRYTYVLNSPTNFIDPLGLCPTPRIERTRDWYCARGGDGGIDWVLLDGVYAPSSFVDRFGTGAAVAAYSAPNLRPTDVPRIGIDNRAYFYFQRLRRTCDSPTSYTNCSPFEIVYEFSVSLPFAELPFDVSPYARTKSTGPSISPRPSASSERADRAATCAAAYYGFGTVASRVAIGAAGAPIPKVVVGLPRALGSSAFTTLPSVLSLGMGAGNWLRAAGRVALPIFVATAVIDTAAIATCTFID